MSCICRAVKRESTACLFVFLLSVSGSFSLRLGPSVCFSRTERSRASWKHFLRYRNVAVTHFVAYVIEAYGFGLGFF